MTLRTRDKLVCDCGHLGLLISSENDQPYGAPWTRHELEGFSGSVDDWNLERVQCPNCGAVGKVKKV